MAQTLRVPPPAIDSTLLGRNISLNLVSPGGFDFPLMQNA
jgi:hypothetical protein